MMEMEFEGGGGAGSWCYDTGASSNPGGGSGLNRRHGPTWMAMRSGLDRWLSSFRATIGSFGRMEQWDDGDGDEHL